MKPLEGFVRAKGCVFSRAGECRSCKSARDATYRKSNPEKTVASRAAYQKANPEKCAARGAAYRKANPGKIAAQWAAWYRANPEKSSASSAAWYKSNTDKVAAKQAAWRKANPEKAAARGAAYRKANPDKVAAYAAAWHKANPEKRSASSALREARKLQASPAWACQEEIEAVYASARRLGQDVDHIYPLRGKTVSGLHVACNLRPLGKTQNRSKKNKLPGILAHELWNPTGPDVYGEAQM